MKFCCQKRGPLVQTAAAQYGFRPDIGQRDICLASAKLVSYASAEAPIIWKTKAPVNTVCGRWQGNVCEEM
jgi:hypothetical protein